MKASFGYVPAEQTWPVGTASFREMLTSLAAIDWFSPPAGPAAAARAQQAFEDFNAMGYKALPKKFSPVLDVSFVDGGWAEFVQLGSAARHTPGFEWKHDAPKALLREHSEAHGWRLKEQTAPPWHEAQPHDFFVTVMGHGAIWRGPYLNLDEPDLVPEPAREIATWYLQWVSFDIIFAVEWQLADDAPLAQNPFYRLFDCYRAGYYPFVFSPTNITLFRFTAAAE